MKTEYVQEPPFCMQIELTEGCNLRCPFCGLQGIREKGPNKMFKFMTLETAHLLAMKIFDEDWNCRLEFAMHGEPTMNPDRVEIIRMFRMILPRQSIMMTSNGGGLVADPTKHINDLMDAGLSTLLLDNYDNVGIVPKIIEKYEGPHPVGYYPDDIDFNPHKRRKPHEHVIVVVADISSSTKGNHSTLNNHAGAAFPKNENAQGKPCAKPFRELSVRWDGNIAFCCNDWRGIHKAGDIHTQSLEEIWHGDQFKSGRRKLIRGIRDFGACQGCDATSHRVGLLPDKMGYEYLDEPTKRDDEILAEALRQSPLATPVLRDYEK